jgi:DNA invertase Pin-like site-specific DNA recombinase
MSDSRSGCARESPSLDAQRDMVGVYAEERGMPLIDGFTEVESAYRPSRMSLDNRPELRAALARCKRLKATLAIAALDRLARNVVLIASLIETRVRFVALEDRS